MYEVGNVGGYKHSTPYVGNVCKENTGVELDTSFVFRLFSGVFRVAMVDSTYRRGRKGTEARHSISL